MSEPLKVVVLLGSVRRGRQSQKVAAFVMTRLAATLGVTAELVDLADLHLPVMEERLAKRDDPPEHVPELGAQIAAAHALLIVTPEYNHGYPGALKNALDYFSVQFKRKPTAVITVSGGGFGGVNCYAQLLPVLNFMGALVVPATAQVSKVQDAFAADGTPVDSALAKRVDGVIAELTWLADKVR